MKKISILALVLIGSVAQASLFTDDFNRAGTLFNSDASVSIGGGYALSQVTGDRATTARITAGQVQINVDTSVGTINGGGIVLRQTGVDLLNSSPDESFTISGDITTHTAPAVLSYGLAFNYQADGSFYAARISNNSTVSALQFIRVNSSGTLQGFGNIVNSVTLDEGSVYNIAISSSDIGVFDYTLTGANLDGGQLTGTVTDTVLNLTGGQAGFYMSNVNTTPRWDNLSISTIPEPATLGFVSIAAAMLFGLRRILG